jgi:hypothetical protein
VQFKYITEDVIIYKNPKYMSFIEELFKKKEEIFKSSLYLFVKSALYHTVNHQLEEVLYEDLTRPNKLLMHLCIVSDLLQEKEINKSSLLKIKRTRYIELPDDIKNYIIESINYLETYINKTDENEIQIPSI